MLGNEPITNWNEQQFVGPAHITYIKTDWSPLQSLLKLLTGQQLSKDSLVVLTLTKNYCKRSIKYKRSKIWNELPISMRNFPSINQFSNKLKRGWVPSGIFFEGLLFLSLPFPFFPSSFLLPSPRCLPCPLSGPLKSSKKVYIIYSSLFTENGRNLRLGDVSSASRNRKHNNLLNVLTNMTHVGETILQLLREVHAPIPKPTVN